MKHYYPTYYERFQCIAAECPDSCCQGWDVVIDSDTEQFYKSEKGDFGEQIRKAIYTDSDGDRVFSLAEGKRCPFWGEDKLCEIYKSLGEEHLCVTCAQFPRLWMEFYDFCEHSLALACPEAARLILMTDDAYASFSQRTAAGCGDYAAETMKLLLHSRLKCAELLRAQKPLDERLKNCLVYAEEVQDQLCPLSGSEESPYSTDTIAKLFSELEYIDDANRGKMVQACHTADFSGQERELSRLALYYLYRYYLKAVDSLNVITPIRLMIISIAVISNLSRGNRLTLAEAAQLYSKEIEQSYENMERITEAFC